MKTKNLPPGLKRYLVTYLKSTLISAALGVAENYGHTSRDVMVRSGGKLPLAEWFPNALWDRHAGPPLGRMIGPGLAYVTYASIFIIGIPLIPFFLNLLQRHKEPGAVKQTLKESGTAAVSSLAVQDAFYWLANPVFKGATTWIPGYTSSVPQDAWFGAVLPGVGEMLGANLPLINLPYGYLIAFAIAGLQICSRIKEGIDSTLSNTDAAKKRV